MPLSTVTVNVGSSGIGRRAPNTDKISGLISFNAAYPSGFSAGAPAVKVFSLAQAVTAGIVQGSANFSVEYYHVSEFFRINPDGELWIGIYPADYTFAIISDFLSRANGEVKQFGIYAPARAYTSGDVTLIQSLLDTNDGFGRNAVCFLAENFFAITAITGWTAITDMRTLSARKVNVVIGQDGGAAGKALYVAKGYTISCLGAILGAVSKSTVSQSIGNPQNFNLSDGTELETPALANGDLVSAMASSAMGALKDKAYTIIRKYTPQISGTFSERQGTSVPLTNALCYVEFNRAIDKAIRQVSAALLPQVNGQLFLNANGTLRNDTAGFFQDLAQTPLDFMLANNEVSAAKATVDPTQNVLGTSTLVVAIQIVPVGIAEQIVVNIGLVTKLT
jgi:Protein of unknown function (DUF2586)